MSDAFRRILRSPDMTDDRPGFCAFLPYRVSLENGSPHREKPRFEMGKNAMIKCPDPQ